MAERAIPYEVNRHLEAALTLSRLDFVHQLVFEAELCLEYDQASAAAILAGIVLEELSSLRSLRVAQKLEANIRSWRELRNRAAHPAAHAERVDRSEVAAMVAGLRAVVAELDMSDPIVGSSRPSPNALTDIRGKYAFVPTSVEDFLRRKREEIDLEDRK